MGINVFISSRFEEFGALRDALSGRLREHSGFVPVDLNDGQASPFSPAQRSLAAAREADALVLLLGQTYSSKESDDGLSLTHQEYREALSQGITVFAYAVPHKDLDPRAKRFLDEVLESTCGRLDGNAWTDSGKIADALDEWVADQEAGGGGEGPDGFAGVIQGEWSYLGLTGVGDFRLSPEGNAGEPLYARVIERRRLAMRALETGHLAAARDQLHAARQEYRLDWSINYALARLLEVRGLRSDQQEALRIAREALDGVGDTTHAPCPRDDASSVIERRTAATLVLQSRLLRRLGDPHTAHTLADRAVAAVPNSQLALQERVRSACAAGMHEAADRDFEALLHLYPVLAANVLRSADVSARRRHLETLGIDFVHKRRAVADAVFGAPAPEPKQQLRAEINALRDSADDRRRSLGDLASATVSLYMNLHVDAGVRRPRVTQTDGELAKTRQELTEAEQALRTAVHAPGAEDPLLAAQSAELRAQGSSARRKVLEAAVQGDAGLVGKAVLFVVIAPATTLLAAVVAAVLGGFQAFSEGLDASDTGGAAFRATLWVVGLLWILPFGWLGFRARRRSQSRAELAALRADKVGNAPAWARELWTSTGQTIRALRARCTELEQERSAYDARWAGEQERRQRVERFLGRPVADMTACLTALTEEFVRFDKAYTSYPNLTTRDYVPVARARPGDITRVGGEDAVTSRGGLLAAADRRRLVRVLSGRAGKLEVSDLGLVLDTDAEQLRWMEEHLA